MDDNQRKTIFDFFRKNPYASAKDISENTGVNFADLLKEIDSNKDFKKSIESIRDTREGLIGA